MERGDSGWRGGDSGWRGGDSGYRWEKGRGKKSQHEPQVLEKVMCVKGSMAHCGFKHECMGATWNTGKEHAWIGQSRAQLP